MKLRNLKLSLLLLLMFFTHVAYSQNWTNNSVLSSGDWFKLSVESSGVYKISPSFISTNNISSTVLNIDEIRIYGNGYGILPANNSVFRKDDLSEIPSKRVDQNQNGKFDGSDYILFFAKGPHEWRKIGNADDFRHSTNFYRDKNFYFISVSSANKLP